LRTLWALITFRAFISLWTSRTCCTF
jgi:hypothetical protein